MEVIIRNTEEAAAGLTAALIDRHLRAKPNLVLGLATGRTMEKVYEELVRRHQDEDLDFSLCRTFNLDEYVGLSPEDFHSYHYYMQQRLFKHVNIDPRNARLPNGLAADLKKESQQFEALIRDCGGIDVQLLGIGVSGHIGFNEPLSALLSRTREKALTPASILQNAPLFGVPERVPKRGITMGVGTILDSRHCILLATGPAKAPIVAKAVEGPITAMVSASALQLHPHCVVIVDEASASELQEADYYRWIFDNEPEWEPFRGK